MAVIPLELGKDLINGIKTLATCEGIRGVDYTSIV
jgi:hypothetical protein